MAKYQITHRCGHSGTHNLIGPSRDRERRMGYLESTLCSDCYREEQEQARAAAAEQAKAEAQEYGLPKLVGTEKQVEWAERIRAEAIRSILARLDESPWFVFSNQSAWVPVLYPELEGSPEFIEYRERTRSDAEGVAKLRSLIQPLLWERFAQPNNAAWWIENRDMLPRQFLTRELALAVWSQAQALAQGVDLDDLARQAVEREMAEKAERAERKRLQAEAAAEATVRPENADTPLVAEIELTERQVTVAYPERNAKLLDVVHRFHSQWDGSQHVIRAEKPAEIAVEVAHRLLAAGIPVRLWDPELRRRAVAGEYQPYTGRKIQRHNPTGKFMITWDRRREDWFSLAERLPGGRWSKETRAILVPASAWREVEDFAQLHQFTLSPGAREVIGVQQEADAKLLPEPIAPVPAVVGATGRPLLEAGTPDVPAHLLDADDADADAHH